MEPTGEGLVTVHKASVDLAISLKTNTASSWDSGRCGDERQFFNEYC